MKNKNSIKIHLKFGELKSFLDTYSLTIRKRKSVHLHTSLNLTQFIFLFLICSIYSLLLLWVSISNRIFCPVCKKRDFTKRSSFPRDQDIPVFDIIIEWRVQRYQCRKCPRSFNSFSNTRLSYNPLHPSVVIFQKLSALKFIPWYIRPVQLRQFTKSTKFSINKLSTAISSDVENIATSTQFYLTECLNEKQRRLFAGLLSTIYPTSGIERVHELTKLARKTIKRGQQEILNQSSTAFYTKPIRNKGAGRKSKVEDVKLQQTVLQLVEPETAGDPITGLKWIRRSLRNLAKYVDISPTTISKILYQNGYSMRVNSKKLSLRGNHPDRDQQFKFIEKRKTDFINQGVTVLSIDGKKKELIGKYKNAGATWVKEPHVTYDHDFPDQAEGILVPFGIYDLHKNHGYVVCGTNHSTSEFAVDAISLWWQNEGCEINSLDPEIYLLCDAGTPNSYRSKIWKWYLQIFADKYDLTIHVSHYPPRTSKWNPIEHRLFSQISLNWQGEPLASYEIALNYISTTKTETGLTVQSILLDKSYDKSQTISDVDLVTINQTSEEICSDWNYTIRPRDERITQLRKIKWEEEKLQNAIWHFENKKFNTKKLAESTKEKLISSQKWVFHEIKFVKLSYYKKKLTGGRGRPTIGSKMKRIYSINLRYQLRKMYCNRL